MQVEILKDEAREDQRSWAEEVKYELIYPRAQKAAEFDV